jgi:hypothetical protein
MKRILAVVVLLAIGLGMNSCKKYDEGPMISLRSKNARMANEWVIDKVMTNGVDVSFNFSDDFLWNIKDDGTYILTSNGVDQDGTWTFDDDKVKITFEEGSTGTLEVFDILMLKNKELTLEQTVLTEVYTYYFVEKP